MQKRYGCTGIKYRRRGIGCPDLSLLPELSKIFNADLEKLLSGNRDINDVLGGNMKKISFTHLFF